MRRFPGAGLGLLMLLLLGGPAEAEVFDGHWVGEGHAKRGDCPAFTLQVSVTDNQVEGEAKLDEEQSYRIAGQLSPSGEFRGRVEYLWMTVAELDGQIRPTRGAGTWQTLKGPACSGVFQVEKF